MADLEMRISELAAAVRKMAKVHGERPLITLTIDEWLCIYDEAETYRSAREQARFATDQAMIDAALGVDPLKQQLAAINRPDIYGAGAANAAPCIGEAPPPPKDTSSPTTLRQHIKEFLHGKK